MTITVQTLVSYVSKFLANPSIFGPSRHDRSVETSGQYFWPGLCTRLSKISVR